MSTDERRSFEGFGPNREDFMDCFKGSREAFQMLRRLSAKGRFQHFNDAIAAELLGRGYAKLANGTLVPTSEGLDASRILKAPAS